MKNILVVEDNEKNMYLMNFLLKKNGYRMIEARSGKKAIELAVKEKPDLIIMDIKLPDIDGLETTKEIRKTKEGSKIPIIAVTSYALPGDEKKALDAGCNRYITKPINPETFIKDIEKQFK